MSRRHDQEHGSKTARMKKQGYVYVHFWLHPELARDFHEAIALTGAKLPDFIRHAAWERAKRIVADERAAIERFNHRLQEEGENGCGE